MGKKKKKRSNTPRAKGMDRAGRLQSAAATGWVQSYNGNNYIRGYRKHYGVCAGTAIAELRLLGVAIDESAARQAKENEKSAARAKQLRKEKRRQRWEVQQNVDEPLSDDTFAYIAGYTDWGVPFGITWEEMEEIEREEAVEIPFDFDEFMQYYANLSPAYS